MYPPPIRTILPVALSALPLRPRRVFGQLKQLRPANSRQHFTSSCSAFTLIELITVMAIMVLLMVMVVPAMTGIKGAGEVTKAAYEFTGLLDSSRAYAIANHTYVFVGFAEVDVTKPDSAKPQVSGTGRVVAAAVASKDGTRMFNIYDTPPNTTWVKNYTSGKNANGANLVPISKLQRFENVHLADSLGTPPTTGNMARYPVNNEYRIGHPTFTSLTPFSWPIGSPLGSAKQPGGQYYFDKVLVFDPQGEARFLWNNSNKPDYSRVQWFEIGLLQTRGTVVIKPPTTSTGNQVAIMISGMTGSSRIYRP